MKIKFYIIKILFFMDKIQTIAFQNDTLLSVNQNGNIYVAIAPICEALGLDVEWQKQAISDNEVLNSEKKLFAISKNENSQARQMVCLPIHLLNGWLFGIQAAKTKAEVKRKLIAYQKECYNVLYNHFFGKYREVETATRSIFACEMDVFSKKQHIKILQLEIRQEEKKILDLKRNVYGQLDLVEIS